MAKDNNNKNNNNKNNNNKNNDNKNNDNKGNNHNNNHNNNHGNNHGSNHGNNHGGNHGNNHGGNHGNNHGGNNHWVTSGSGGGGNKPPKPDRPNAAAANFANQYISQQQKNNNNKGNNNKPNNNNSNNKGNNSKPNNSRPSSPSQPSIPGLPGQSNRPSNNSNDNRGNSGSGNRSIEQIFGGGNLTNKEFEKAKQQHGGAAVKDWIRANASKGQIGGNLKDRLKNQGSMQGFFGRGQGSGSGSDSSVDTSGGNQDQGNDYSAGNDEGTYDYAAEMESMLAPLREQITQLNTQLSEKKTAEAAKPNFTPDAPITFNKDSYSYTPKTGSSSVNTTPDYYQNWLSQQESFNRASTAYLFAPGGTRREEEPHGANAASDANHDSNGDWRNFWNPSDSNEIQRAWSTPAADGFNDEANQRRARSNRMAGDVFSDAQPTVR